MWRTQCRTWYFENLQFIITIFWLKKKLCAYLFRKKWMSLEKIWNVLLKCYYWLGGNNSQSTCLKNYKKNISSKTFFLINNDSWYVSKNENRFWKPTSHFWRQEFNITFFDWKKNMCLFIPKKMDEFWEKRSLPQIHLIYLLKKIILTTFKFESSWSTEVKLSEVLKVS